MKRLEQQGERPTCAVALGIEIRGDRHSKATAAGSDCDVICPVLGGHKRMWLQGNLCGQEATLPKIRYSARQNTLTPTSPSVM